MSEPSPEIARELPGEWRHVAEELPPFGVIVEARVSLSEKRSIILSVMCAECGAAAAVSWVNSTTGGPLREGWRPLEWRYAAGSALQPSAASAVHRRA